MTQLDREYAVALYGLAAESGAQDEYVTSLRVVVDALKAHPQYVDFLASPGIPIRERLAALEEAFLSSVHEHVLSLTQLLCEKGAIASLPDIAAEYKRMVDEYHRRSQAIVRSSVPLTEDERVRLREKLEKMSGHSVKLVCQLDPTLLGGVVVEMDGRCIDGSLRRRLHEVKDVMNG